MKIVQISHERTYNTGNYTSQRFGMTASLEEHDDPDLAMLGLAVILDRAANKAMHPDTDVTLKPLESDW